MQRAVPHVPLRLGRVPIYTERIVRLARALDIRVAVWTVARGQWAPLAGRRTTRA